METVQNYVNLIWFNSLTKCDGYDLSQKKIQNSCAINLFIQVSNRLMFYRLIHFGGLRGTFHQGHNSNIYWGSLL